MSKTTPTTASIGEGNCSEVGSASLHSTLLNLGMTNTAAGAALQAQDDYKALVCLFLGGGNDSFNMLAPLENGEYADYAAIRSDLAISKGEFLALNPVGAGGRSFGLHPSMPEVKTLFDGGKLSFVSNVGTLVEPTTLNSYENGTAKLPSGLYSHSDQIMQWQTSVPDRQTPYGWGGRTADLLHSLNSNDNISMNISLSGSNVFQAGKQTVEYAIGPQGNGSIGITGFGKGGTFNQLRTAAIESMIDLHYENLFQQAFVDINRNAIAAHEQFSSALGSAAPLAVSFSPNFVSRSFEMIARTISARKALGMRRQTFFIMFGGWDHHDEVLNNQIAMLSIVSKALSEFSSAIDSLGLGENVVTFTSSDFGRTLTSNGRGSDHAWGGNQIVMGGPIRGGQVHGDYPSLRAGNDLDTGRGRLIPSISCDEYFAELALWFGVDPSELDTVFPNIKRFYSPSAGQAPVGFLNLT